MDNTQTMLKAIINGQSALKEEILKKIDQVDKKVDKLEMKMDVGFKSVNTRIDEIGSRLAYLEDDAPTREEFDELSEDVGKLKVKIASV